MKTKTLFLLTGFLTILYSCEDFIEVNLSNKQVKVISPADNTVSSSFSQTFWWEELKGAESYQIQIVRPNFSSIQQFIADTTVHFDKLTLTLQPGVYQWRIRGKNNSSVTDYFTYNLTIDSTLNLSGQSVVLSTPINNQASNSLLANFSWQTMPNADSYILQILSNGSLIHTNSFTTNSGSYTFSGEGIYEWRVFAQNTVSNSSYFTRMIEIDTTKPNIPILLSPLTDTITADPLVFNWSLPETDLTYRIQISTDSTFVTVEKDTITASDAFSFYNTTINQYYYWRVRAIDKAANQSAYSAPKRIKRN